MPDPTIPTPVAANPIDRLTLGATDARSASLCACPSGYPPQIQTCMAEE
jgi:hypothetical protein